MIRTDESSQRNPLGIELSSMGLLFSWPSTRRVWTVGDFWTDSENLWRPLHRQKHLSQWTEMTLGHSSFDYIIFSLLALHVLWRQ